MSGGWDPVPAIKAAFEANVTLPSYTNRVINITLPSNRVKLTEIPAR